MTANRSRVAASISRLDRPAWHADPALLASVLSGLVSSAEPTVAFTSLAAAVVPILADECVVIIRELPGDDCSRTSAYTVRHPVVPCASSAPPTDLAVDADGASVTSSAEVADDDAHPGCLVTATFGWHHRYRLDPADQAIGDMIVARVVDGIGRERLGAALECARDKVSNLTVALESNRHIGQAVGILMATYKLTDAQAFDLLRGASQYTHRKLRDVAEDVCTTGTLDATAHLYRAGPHADSERPALRAVHALRR